MNPLDPQSYLDPLQRLVAGLPLAYSFAAGLVAALNPCGFIMLPSFAALQLGFGGRGVGALPLPGRLLRALVMGALVTLGFVAVFGLVGLPISLGAQGLLSVFPWTSLVVGSLLVALGLWLLWPGHYLVLPAAARVVAPEGQGPLFALAFGVAYAVASLGCTLPIFLVVAGSSLASGLLGGLLQFLNYALGMGVMVSLVAVAMALLREAALRPLRRLLPHVERLAALFLIAAGVYLIAYWLRYGSAFV
ncbi:MAG TPA: cytochrome c biogenesis protein CcdA [Dehalococcoidia bacterium]|nr:cytochrome c biogenesis protein CcdA [Dehalococcoidia bacterium]